MKCYFLLLVILQPTFRLGAGTIRRVFNLPNENQQVLLKIQVYSRNWLTCFQTFFVFVLVICTVAEISIIFDIFVLQFHAMNTLHKHSYDCSKAIRSLVPDGGPVLCRDEMEEWSASEANLFEEALDKYGKDFNDIRQDFVSSSCSFCSALYTFLKYVCRGVCSAFFFGGGGGLRCGHERDDITDNAYQHFDA